jgi:hypothetical protein
LATDIYDNYKQKLPGLVYKAIETRPGSLHLSSDIETHLNIMAGFEIHVTGKGSTYRPAERAILVLRASSSKLPSAKEATVVVTNAANTIREIISPFCPSDNSPSSRENAAIAHYSMSTLHTSNQTQVKRTKDESTGGSIQYDTFYAAKAEFHIKFSDFALLGQLATQFSAMEDVTIEKIDWRLTEENERSIHSETRQKAAKDLLERAYDYAMAIANVSESELKDKVKPKKLTESPYYTKSTRPHLHRGKEMYGQEGNSEEITFQPEDVSLEVTVEGVFIVE